MEQTADYKRNHLNKIKRVVVKIGSSLIAADPSNASWGINTSFINNIATQVNTLRQKGVEVTLVTSGAIATGCLELGIKKRPRDVSSQQALAAVGQRKLMTHVHKAFSRHGMTIGQVLLSRDDFDDRIRFLNIRNCITQLHKLGCVPVINENDTAAVDEIRFGDNDLLAAGVCNCLGCDGLILLTSVDGLLDKQNQVIDVVADIDQVLSLASGKSRWGSGGMASKLQAARRVTSSGEPAVIAPGLKKDVLISILSGQRVGTLLVPEAGKLSSRKKWIGFTARPSGTVTVDGGAARALLKGGKSLLPSGVVKISGHFERGDVVLVHDDSGQEIARGLTNYPSSELGQIMGKRSSQFEKILGKSGYSELIHRDNLHLTLVRS